MRGERLPELEDGMTEREKSKANASKQDINNPLRSLLIVGTGIVTRIAKARQRR